MISGNIPNPSTVLASSSQWFTALSSDWMSFAYIAIGVVGAVVLVTFLIRVFIGAFHKLTDHNNKTEHKGLKMIEVPGGWDVEPK